MAKYEGGGFNHVVSVEVNLTAYKDKSVWGVWVSNKDPDISQCTYACEDFSDCVEWIKLNVTAPPKSK